MYIGMNIQIYASMKSSKNFRENESVSLFFWTHQGILTELHNVLFCSDRR